MHACQQVAYIANMSEKDQNETKPVMLNLKAPVFADLESEAKVLGLKPGTMARIILEKALRERKLGASAAA